MQAGNVSVGQKSRAVSVLRGFRAWLPDGPLISLLLGPIAALVIWWLPLGLEPVAHRAVAVVSLMLVYWMTELLDYGVTALIGCLLFWPLHVARPEVAFSGFSTPTPWFMLGGLLIGQATTQTGLATRLGYYAVYVAKGSPTRLLLGFTVLVFVLSLLLASAAQVTALAPVAIGIVAALGLTSHSNMAKGLFLILSYVSSTCAKMILSAGVPILAWGIMEKQAGVHVLWSQWFLAFLPLALPTILSSWLTIHWLYPPETAAQPTSHASWQDLLRSLGPLESGRAQSARLAQKAFYPGPIPFPLLHIDTGWKFREMIAFRDRTAAEVGFELLTYTNPRGVAEGVGPITHGSAYHTDVMKTEALKQALDLHGFDVAFGGARRDEEKSRAKERLFSFRAPGHRWDPKAQRPELWNVYNTRINAGETIRVFPLSNWTEADIWAYIHQENIPIVPLYFAAKRPVVKRFGQWIMVDDSRLPLEPGETPEIRLVRFRTLGCYPLTAAIESSAARLDEIVAETLGATTSERQGRIIDHDGAGSMERKKQEGYF